MRTISEITSELTEILNSYGRQRDRVASAVDAARQHLADLQEQHKAAALDGRDDEAEQCYLEMLTAQDKLNQAELRLSAFTKTSHEYQKELLQTEGEHRTLFRELDETASLEMEREVVQPTLALLQEMEDAKDQIRGIHLKIIKLAHKGSELSSVMTYARTNLPAEQRLSYSPSSDAMPSRRSLRVEVDPPRWTQMERPALFGRRAHPILDRKAAEDVVEEVLA